MDTELSNGASDSNSSGTAVLSRKGLFGKSGVANETFDTSIAIERDPVMFSDDAPNRDSETTDMSSSSCNVTEVSSVDVQSNVVENQSEHAVEKQSEHVVEKQSEDVVEDQSEHMAEEQSEDVAEEQSEDVVEEQSEHMAEKQSEHVSEEQSEHVAEKQSEHVSEEQSEHVAEKQSEHVAEKQSEHVAEEHSEQCANEDGTSDEHESGELGDKKLEESSIEANVPCAKDSGDLACKEHDESSLGLNTQDQHFDNKVQEKEYVGDSKEVHDHGHEEGDSGDNDDNVDRSSPNDVLPSHQEGGEVPEITDEIYIKKIISMDTADAEEDHCDAPSVPSDVEAKEKGVGDVGSKTLSPEKSSEEKEVEDSSPAEKPCDEGDLAEDLLQESSSKPGDEHVVTQENDGNSSSQVVDESATKKETTDEASEKNTVETTDIPKRRSSTRRTMTTAQAEVKTPNREAVTEKKAKSSTSSIGRNKKKESALKEVKNTDDGHNSSVVKEEESLSEKKSLRSRSHRINVKDTSKSAPSTPSQKKGKRSIKLDFGSQNENNDDAQEAHSGKPKREHEGSNGDSTRRPIRRRSAKLPANRSEGTPKSGARSGLSSKEKSKINTEKEVAGSHGTETPRRGKKDSAKKPDSSSKTTLKKGKEEKQKSHDPYDIETEMEKHPEPLKNIQMEVQSFGEVKYAKVGSGKYERTEKTAELRVGNLADMTPRTKQRKSLADLAPARVKVSPTLSGCSTAPQPRRSRKSKRDDEEEPMDVDNSVSQDTGQKKKAATTTPKSGSRSSGTASRSSGKRRASPPTSASPSKRPRIVLPELSAEELLAVDHPHDEHAPYDAGARVYAMFDGLFYPAIVVSRDGLGRYKVNFVEDNIIKDVPPAGVIPLRALDRDKDCYFSDTDQKDRLAARVVSGPDVRSALAWLNAEFELEQLNDEGEPSGKKFKATWTKLALSKEDWRDYINKKSREATDVITDNIENTEDRQLRRTRVTPSSKVVTPVTSKSTIKTQKLTAKPSSKSKSSSKNDAVKNDAESSSSKSGEADDGRNVNAPRTGDEQIFAGKLFILTSANRPNTDTGFKKKFMTDFISTHGGLVVDDMKEVDEHPNMERFLVSDTHYRTHKYLAALVRAMPCVSHEWIYKCLNEKKLVDYKPFLLPSGVSILDEKEYPLPTERGVLLRNKKVMVHSNVIPPSKKSMSFEQIWVPMVPQLGGEIVSDIPDEEGKLDILLTDHSATASMVEKARKIGCAVVSSEWLIQLSSEVVVIVSMESSPHPEVYKNPYSGLVYLSKLNAEVCAHNNLNKTLFM